ncbi:MAG: glycine cleavage system aminomethyltransferase GcvT [Verrucomicrobia bacterium]|nr:glycine cleavage system aminomethyltransferase GcvT [Verrucomicrobiota bacterium]
MQTSLYNDHVALGARMVPFAGWEMPLVYRGIIPEHLWTRAHASVFDICHMGEFGIKGATAEADLERLVTLGVASLKPGACAYGYLLAEDGGVQDDVICFRLGADRFWLVVNAGTLAGDRDWIRAHLSPRTTFTDLSPAMAKLDIQGPCACLSVEAALGQALPLLGYFHFQEVTIQDTPCLLSRTGYTGEFGYELYVPANEVPRFWNLLLKSGQILPAGLGARDTLRVEMGYPLYGHELRREWRPPTSLRYGASGHLAADVAGASRGRFMDMAKPFIGREAVRRELETGAFRVLVGLLLEGRMAGRAGDPVMKNGIGVGEVTSGLFAPSLNVAVALAYVDQAVSRPGEALAITGRRKSLNARVEALPLYKKGTARRS